MDIISTQKYIVTSPRKLRLVAGMIKKLSPIDAIARLPFSQKRAAMPLSKVIKSAVANARQAGLADTDLIFKEIQIGEGPRLKRGRPVSRGQWHPVKRRMSHIRVVLTTKGQKVEVVKEVKSETLENEVSTKKVVTKKGKK